MHKLLRSILIKILRSYLEFALKTTRWQLDIPAATKPFLTCEHNQPALIIFWHETILLSPQLWWWALLKNPNLQIYALISRNRDGRLIMDVVKPWKVRVIQGSSNKGNIDKGGAAAFRELLKHTRDGHLVAITPDGPRGPKHTIHSGLLKLALLSKRRIVPVGAYCRAIRVNSWDKMILPLPFGRGYIVYADPIEVTKENYEHIKNCITSSLNEVTQKAQSLYLGKTP
ncbi:hypothetical protein COMNV_00552 [Commensalibacter sp. Nvir]|uniref:lysophospholipid acyltransferase family protein n=1 Tax=Commensalibacter sp. Nvir TaxID=3069817 RepID=UPI002D7105DF|nr:hypothetical protein COMNV_00552 [Commensalibacter sp. Nvir]